MAIFEYAAETLHFKRKVYIIQYETLLKGDDPLPWRKKPGKIIRRREIQSHCP
jgi:hypothetical protein